MSRAGLLPGRLALALMLCTSGCLIIEGTAGLSDGADAGVDSGVDAGAESGIDAGDATPPADAMGSSPFDGGDAADAGGPALLAYYAFDDAAGMVAADSSGMGHAANLVGGANFGPGLRNGGVILDATTGYVSLPAGLLAGLTSFSVSLWVNITAGSVGAHLFDFGTDASTHMYLAPISSTSTLRFAITTAGQGGEQSVEAPPIPTGKWEHLAVTMAQGTVTLYVNGQKVQQSATFSETPASLGALTQSWIGRSESSPTDPYLGATLDELRIYSGALSAADVLQQARMLPYAWYSFDEGAGMVAHNASGNGNDATLYGGATWGPGRKGDAVVLDGKTGYVALPTSILGSSTEATVGGWLYAMNLTSSWQRFFDFGSGSNTYMDVTPRNLAASMQFSITLGGRGAEQTAVGAVPATGAWQFIAVTLHAGTAQLWLSGLPAGSPATVTINPSQLGATLNDWIGRSQYSIDPFLAGSVDDFFVYTRGLSAAEIAVLAR
jgi:hypothetical protein